MRNVEPTRTPATTRKRARCQASSRATAGSLSLLAVPKLKTAVPAPSNGAKNELVAASDPSECESRAKPQGSFEQQATSALVTAAGKENQPVSVSWAVGLNGKRSMQPAQPQQTQVQALLKQHPSQYMQQAKLESPTAKHPKGPKMIPNPQQAVPVLNSFHIAAPNSKTCSTESADAIHTVDSIHAGDNNHAGPTLLPSLVKQTIPVPSGPLHRPAFRAEPEHELPSGEKVPLACQTVINKRRRPVGQAIRYGEWYTGNDTDLDEHLLEYNAEQAMASTENGLDRRKSAFPTYTDVEDSDLTDEEDVMAVKRISRLRRSTIAPGQDTAAQVAAMTAELSRLAEDLLPQEEEEAQGKHARRHQQNGQGSKDLRQRLLDSWDGKTYYERLQAEAEGQHGAPSRAETAHSRKSSEAATQDPMAGVRHTADRVVGQAQPISEVQQSTRSTAVAAKVRQETATPISRKDRLLRSCSPGKHQTVMSPELRGSSESEQQLTGQTCEGLGAVQWVAAHSEQQGKGKAVGGKAGTASHFTRPGITPKKAPPLPPMRKHPQHGTSSRVGKANSGLSRPVSRQQSAAQAVKGQDISDNTAGHEAAPSSSQHHHHAQAVKSNTCSAGSDDSHVAGATSQPVRPARAGRGTAVATPKVAPSVEDRAQHVVTTVPGRVKPGESASTGQQQLARLTASNTSLLSELVDLQAAKNLLEAQVGREHEAIRAAKADNAQLAEQLKKEREARTAAEQQASQLQLATEDLTGRLARLKNASLSGQLQSSAAAAAMQDRLNDVKQHAAALAEAAAALQPCMKE